MTLKSRAEYAPQTYCMHFREYDKNFDCIALTECWCCLEGKPCSFYKNLKGIPQGPHSRIAIKKPTMTKEDFEKVKAYHFGRSWARAAEKYGYTIKQVNLARQKYDPDGDKGPTPRPKITTEVLDMVVDLHDGGMTWKDASAKAGYSDSVICKRLKKDAEKGIRHGSKNKV